MIRQWRAQLLGNGTSVSEAAKAYRFLRAVLMMAVDDQIIPRNPCRVPGAGTERPDERPVLAVRQVLDLADQMPTDDFKVMVLLAAFASLRWAELVALRRCGAATSARWLPRCRYVGRWWSWTRVSSSSGRRSRRRVSAPSPYRPPSSAPSGSTSRRPLASPRMRCCSLALAAGYSVVAASAALSAGRRRPPRSAFLAPTFTIKPTFALCRHRHNHDLRHTGNTLSTSLLGVRAFVT